MSTFLIVARIVSFLVSVIPSIVHMNSQLEADAKFSTLSDLGKLHRVSLLCKTVFDSLHEAITDVVNETDVTSSSTTANKAVDVDETHLETAKKNAEQFLASHILDDLKLVPAAFAAALLSSELDPRCGGLFDDGSLEPLTQEDLKHISDVFGSSDISL